MKLKPIVIVIPAVVLLITLAGMVGKNVNTVTIDLSDKNGQKICEVSYREYTGELYDACGNDLRCVCDKIGR